MNKKELKTWKKPKLEEHNNNIVQSGANTTFAENTAGNSYAP